jgi:hypothetical protein
MEDNIPKHEQLKKELANKFTPTTTYLGNFVKQTIMQSDFKELKSIQPPQKIKKGDVFIAQFKKPRPCVVVKVLKDSTCFYMPLTSSENVHCGTPYKSRFFGEGCFSKTISVCTEEYALFNFVGVFDNVRDINQAIKDFKKLIVEQL